MRRLDRIRLLESVPHVLLAAFVFVLVASILALTALAYADPPDPTSQIGASDDDDVDQTIGLIVPPNGLPEVAVARCPGPVAVRIALRGPRSAAPVRVVPLPSSDPRAPPSL